MIELDELDSKLNAELDKLSIGVDSLNKKEYNQKNDAIKICQVQVKSISTLIESYELEISYLDKAQSSKQYKLKKIYVFSLNKIMPFFLFLLFSFGIQICSQFNQQAQINIRMYIQYNDSLKSNYQRFQRLKNELEFKKNDVQTSENLFKGRSEQQPQRLDNMNKQQVIDMGDQMQKNATIKLEDIKNQVIRGNAIADQINMDLDQQIEQLDSMYDTVKDTQSVLQKSSGYIKYFAKQVYNDKLLMCLIGLIFIAIIVVILLSALGLDDGKFNTPDQVKGSLASNRSTTTTTTGSG